MTNAVLEVVAQVPFPRGHFLPLSRTVDTESETLRSDVAAAIDDMKRAAVECIEAWDDQGRPEFSEFRAGPFFQAAWMRPDCEITTDSTTEYED